MDKNNSIAADRHIRNSRTDPGTTENDSHIHLGCVDVDY